VQAVSDGDPAGGVVAQLHRLDHYDVAGRLQRPLQFVLEFFVAVLAVVDLADDHRAAGGEIAHVQNKDKGWDLYQQL